MPNPDVFYPDYYMNIYPDVVKVLGRDANKALSHYKTYGTTEGRSPNPFFHPTYYLGLYSDLQRAYGQDLTSVLYHWLAHGINEGRRGSPAFDPRFYFSNYSDLSAAYGTNYKMAYEHWTVHGMREGRRTIPEADGPIYTSNGQVNQEVVARISDQRVGAVIQAGGQIIDWVARGIVVKEVIESIREWVNSRDRGDRDIIDRDGRSPGKGELDLPGHPNIAKLIENYPKPR